MSRLFYRYQHRFSNGPGEWEYGDTTVNYGSWEVFVSEKTEELHREYDWSEHYRGVTIESVDLPPLEWLKEQANDSKRAAEGHLLREAEFNRLIAERGAALDRQADAETESEVSP